MRRNVVVLGGGIGGLSAAHFIKNRARRALEPATVRVVEASPRFGGNVSSVRCDRYLFETGPRSIRVTENAVATLKLIQRLDLEKHMIVGPPLVGLTYHKGHIGPFESHLGFRDLMRVVGRVIREPFVRRTTKEDESIYDWSMRRLGPYLTEFGLDPMISGIYAGDIKKLSMRSCLPKFWKWEQEHGSVIRGTLHARREAKRNLSRERNDDREEHTPRNPLERALEQFSNMPVTPGGMFSFTNGISMLTDALAKDLAPEEKITGKVTGLRLRKHGAAVELEDGSVLECDDVVSALPNHVIAPLLKPHNERLSELLGQVKPTSLVVVNFGFSQPLNLPPAFGYLIPSSDALDAIGVVFDTSTFPAQNPGLTVLTLMLGGEHQLHVMDLPETEIAARAMRHLTYHTTLAPEVTNVTKWHNAIPQYTVGHHARVAEVEEIIKGNYPYLRLAGSGLYGVGVNDCTLRSQRIANEMFVHVKIDEEAEDPAVESAETKQ